MRFAWNDEKNEQLKTERGISFEEVVLFIEAQMMLDIINHPKPDRYGNQRAYIIDTKDYKYLVPFVDSGGIRLNCKSKPKK
jgi:uncharacterized DUF497 family protein